MIFLNIAARCIYNIDDQWTDISNMCTVSDLDECFHYTLWKLHDGV